MTITCTLSELEDLSRSIVGDVPRPINDHDADLVETLRQTADWLFDSAAAVEQIAEAIPLGSRAGAKAKHLADLRAEAERLRKRAELIRAKVAGTGGAA